MNYFCVRVGSVRLSILELHNFLKQLSTPTVSWRLPVNNSLCFLLYVSENRTVFRAGLFYSNNFILEHQSCFIWLFYLPIFFTEGSTTFPISSPLTFTWGIMVCTGSGLSKHYFKVSGLLSLGLMSHFYDMLHGI